MLFALKLAVSIMCVQESQIGQLNPYWKDLPVEANRVVLVLALPFDNSAKRLQKLEVTSALLQQWTSNCSNV